MKMPNTEIVEPFLF